MADIISRFKFARMGYDEDQLRALHVALRYGIPVEDIKEVMTPEYNMYQLAALRVALRYGIPVKDIKEVMRPEYNENQLGALLKALKEGIPVEDIKEVMTPEYNWDQLGALREALSDGIPAEDIKEVMRPEYDLLELMILRESLIARTQPVVIDDKMIKEALYNYSEWKDLPEKAGIMNYVDKLYMGTNVGQCPLIDYVDIKAQQYGYSDYKELVDDGFGIDLSGYTYKNQPAGEKVHTRECR